MKKVVNSLFVLLFMVLILSSQKDSKIEDSYWNKNPKDVECEVVIVKRMNEILKDYTFYLSPHEEGPSNIAFDSELNFIFPNDLDCSISIVKPFSFNLLGEYGSKVYSFIQKISNKYLTTFIYRVIYIYDYELKKASTTIKANQIVINEKNNPYPKRLPSFPSIRFLLFNGVDVLLISSQKRFYTLDITQKKDDMYILNEVDRSELYQIKSKFPNFDFIDDCYVLINKKLLPFSFSELINYYNIKIPEYMLFLQRYYTTNYSLSVSFDFIDMDENYYSMDGIAPLVFDTSNRTVNRLDFDKYFQSSRYPENSETRYTSGSLYVENDKNLYKKYYSIHPFGDIYIQLYNSGKDHYLAKIPRVWGTPNFCSIAFNGFCGTDYVTYVKDVIDGLSIKERIDLLNHVYALHDFKFDQKKTLEYFSKYSWYSPVYDMVTVKDLMTDEQIELVGYLKRKIN